MKPSICRLVVAQTDPHTNNGTDVCPAVITRVWGERQGGGWTVNVKLIKDAPSHNDEWRTSAVLFETEEAAREYGPFGLFWPPRI